MNTHALRYVCVDVPSDDSADGMIYYTQHTHMGAPHYECVYVSSD
jgi:hypothetical protein